MNTYSKSKSCTDISCVKTCKDKESSQPLRKDMNNMTEPKNYRRVAIITQGSTNFQKDYAYALYDDDIKIGDKVLVSGVASDQVWVVKGILYPNDPRIQNDPSIKNIKITEEVVCKVDTSAYEARVATRKRANELTKQLEDKIKEIEARKDYEYYSKIDHEFATLYKEWRELEVY